MIPRSFDEYDPCAHCSGETCERGGFCVYNGYDGYGATFEECWPAEPDEPVEPPVCKVCGSKETVSYTTHYCIEHMPADELPF